MRFYKIFTIALAAICAPLITACSDDEAVDNRDVDYGYVQFKLYKEASYAAAAPASRAVKQQLDYLGEACKVKVTLAYGQTTIAQTLPLSSADAGSAEFGLRSDKLKLLTGSYTVATFELYDALDQVIYQGSDSAPQLEITSGGLTMHDLTVDVAPRGNVRFSLVKDIDTDLPNAPTRAAVREYTFDEIAYFTITVQNRSTNSQTRFDRLPMKFSIHFDEENDKNNTPGYQTSSSHCDSLLSLPAGNYRVYSYECYDKNKILLESNTRPKTCDFTVEDNSTTEAKAAVTLYESDEYIKDGYALYEIWKALDGPNWYASGESDAQGGNWDFNKDPDLWCDQPGVQVHSNGRVARIAINDFGYRGHVPAAIGQLTELIELYLGTHNDNNGNNLVNYDPSLALDMSLTERSRNRMANHKAFMAMIHPATQFSEPCARGMELKGVEIPATALYRQGYSEDQIIDRKSGDQRRIGLMDMNHGVKTNGLKSLPKEIGRLTKLEYLYIANGDIEELPDEMENLTSCTDIEIYNCPEMKKFPMVLARMPKIVSLNISNNAQWSADEIYKGLDALATGKAQKEIQILYARQNNLEVLPASMSNLKKIGLLDLAQNKIHTLNALGKDVAPTQLYLNHNRIEKIPTKDGWFCGIDDVETISLSHNRLTEFPNIFTSKTKYIMGSVDVSNNMITGFPDDFKGINVETLTLARNPITKYPKCLNDTKSQVSYIILRGCQVDEIPEGSFVGEYSHYLMSLDLSYNRLTDLPTEFSLLNMPSFYGLDISYNALSHFPFEPLSCMGLTIYAIRGQRDADGNRTLQEWPTGIGKHQGLRALYIGSNDLRRVNDDISPTIFFLDISDNPNITFDASGICAYWQAGLYNLIYDRKQNILGCDAMLQ